MFLVYSEKASERVPERILDMHSGLVYDRYARPDGSTLVDVWSLHNAGNIKVARYTGEAADKFWALLLRLADPDSPGDTPLPF